MKITKQLKYAEFEWDEENKSFTITEEDGNRVILNKVYAFAFMRFVVRMAQRNWLRTSPSKNKKRVVELADHPFEDSLQTKFLNEEYEVISPISEVKKDLLKTKE